eukprot:m.134170 g.134170  ORF g.134170 m.134170 type:complete len:663 (-) comp29724_c1_seq1:79-2067(-)
MSLAKKMKMTTESEAAGKSSHRDGLFVVPKEAMEHAIAMEDWIMLAAFHRINALTCCKSAEHGWLGGSYSCIEMLSTLHLRCKPSSVVLAKGHAAAAQYAVLYAAGKLTKNDLCNYKNGTGGLEAHADIEMDTGSLGQCLSTVAGMAATSSASDVFAVVLGDGEMQEGQIYEALMTLKKMNLTNVVVFIDLNGFQSDNLLKDIMPIHNLKMVLEGFGFHVHEIDGHSHEEIWAAWSESRTNGDLNVIMATTTKGGGTNLIAPSVHPVTQLTWQPWHTKVPAWPLYLKMIREQLDKAGCAETLSAFEEHVQTVSHGEITHWDTLANTHRPSYGTEVGTGKAFGEHLVQLCLTNNKLAIVDADLATSCGINGAVNKPYYFELGVSEQDAVSFAAGLALKGRIPVMNTYSNFLKRAYENIFISILEKANIIFAGHYSGLCYHTDGKSHQSFVDLGSFVGVHPNLLVVDPSTPMQAVALLDKLLAEDALTRPVYFRLRRTPCPSVNAVVDLAAKQSPHGYTFDTPLVVPPRVRVDNNTELSVCFVTIGTVATKLALDCQTHTLFERAPIVVVCALNIDANALFWENLFAKHSTFIVIEDDPGAVYKFVCTRVVEARNKNPLKSPKIISHNVSSSGPSQRTLEACLHHFGFTVEATAALYTDSLCKT